MAWSCFLSSVPYEMYFCFSESIYRKTQIIRANFFQKSPLLVCIIWPKCMLSFWRKNIGTSVFELLPPITSEVWYFTHSCHISSQSSLKHLPAPTHHQSAISFMPSTSTTSIAYLICLLLCCFILHTKMQQEERVFKSTLHGHYLSECQI